MRISDWSSDVCSSDLHLAGLDVDQVIVVRFGRGLVARTAVAEIMAIEDAGLLEQPHRALDGRDRNPRIDPPGGPIEDGKTQRRNSSHKCPLRRRPPA